MTKRKNKEDDIYESNGPFKTEIATKMDAEIVDIEQVETIVLENINNKKAELRARREQIMLSVDSQKLDQVSKLIILMGNTLDQMSALILSGEPDAKAYRDFAEAYSKMNQNLSSLSRLDTDCKGDFTEIHLTIERK